MLRVVRKVRETQLKQTYSSKSSYKYDQFSEKLVESIKEFAGPEIPEIKVVLQNVNKSLSVRFKKEDAKKLRKMLYKLKKFFRQKFFREGINLMAITLKKKNSAELFANFIARRVQTLKRHKFFFIFLKQALKLLLESSLFNIKGFKIIISGRINGYSRAKKVIISHGTIPLQTFRNKIYYGSSVAYTENGTLGVKVNIF